MLEWDLILYGIFLGAADSVDADKVDENVKASLNTMRIIITTGWSIYPLNYFLRCVLSSMDDDALNVVYNLTDFINSLKGSIIPT